MPVHACGTFTVKMGAPKPGPAAGLSSFTMEKHFQGSFEGSGRGEMIAGSNYQTEAAGYVAIKTLNGTLQGKHGSFALQHTATMKGKALNMTITVTPGSGTGELKGIDGSFVIAIKDGQHFYDWITHCHRPANLIVS